MSRRLAGLAGLLIIILTGCALFVRPQLVDPDPGTTTSTITVSVIDTNRIAPGVKTPYWDLVRRGGPLVVGINTSYPPFGIPVLRSKLATGEAKQAFAGFDVELAEHLAATLGVPLVLRGVRSQDVSEALNTGKIDIAIAGLTRTAFRAAQVNFSAPYLTVSQAALVERRLVEGNQGGTDQERRRDTMEDYFDLARVPGLRIGVANNTRPHRLALDNFPRATLVPYPSIQDASAGLIAGEVNALVHDAPFIRVWNTLNPGAANRFAALLKQVTREPIAMAIRKGDLEFLRFLDVYVEEVRQDGTVERYLRRHFVDAAWRSVADLSEANR